MDKKYYLSNYSYREITNLGRKFKASYQRSIFSNFIPSLPPGAQILEIGSGRGEFANEVVKREHSYIGIEPSRELREQLRRRGLKIISEPIPNIALPDNSIDVVHSCDVVEHLLTYTDVLNFFEEAYRVLKKGGILSVIAPNYDTLQSLFFRYDYQHNFITNLERIEGLIKDSGFAIERSVSFLTPIGLTRIRFLDRILVHILLPFARNSLICSLVKKIIGDNTLFKLHKNLYDHVGVIGRKPNLDESS